MGKRTYRVLVADDEYWICENLRHMIAWEDYGLKFLEPTYDGEEVIKRLEEEAVDILITDINMPFLNGLDLLHKVHEKYPNIISMVISGYDDFVNVKGAFMEGSINYILKPISKADLVNSLSKAIELIGEQDAIRLKEEKQKLEAQKTSSYLQDNEFSMMLLSSEQNTVPSISMNCDINLGGVNLILLKFHNLTALSKLYKHDMLLLSYSVKKKIKEALSMEKIFVFHYSYHVNEFMICGEMQACEQKIAVQKISALFPEEEVGPTTIVLGEQMYMIENLKEAYHEAIGVLMMRPFNQHSIILRENHIKEEIGMFISKEEEKELSMLLSRQDTMGLELFLFETIGIAHSQTQNWSLLKMRQVLSKVMNQIFLESEGSVSMKEYLSCGILADMAEYEVNQLNLPAIIDLLKDIIHHIVKEQNEKASDTILNATRAAIAYVDKNFCEALTLSELAEKFHVEASYFSKLFRQESGENFIPYITKKKMEHAIALMEKEELNLTEISFLVGYEDYGYFNRVFRKYKGCSPKDYRKAFGQRKETAK